MKFLSAQWRKLAIINYEINPELLENYLPNGVVLDFWKGKCFVSVVGFMLQNTKLLGITIPFHTDFEEVNLRFYVKKLENGSWKRGVVFIKEIVPKRALSIVANAFYSEHYQTCEMGHDIQASDQLEVEYFWRNGCENSVKIVAENHPQKMVEYSEFEFITEHYFGFTTNVNETTEYEVKHPKWDFYPVKNSEIKIDFEKNYGKDFSLLDESQPHSVMLAEGSAIEVHTKKKLPSLPF